MNRLANKIAVITGGTAGIGLATAAAYIAEGAKVIITGRNAEALDKALAALGPNAKGIISDAASFADIKTLRARIAAIHPKIDTLFVNAGVVKLAPIEAVTEADFDEQFNINVKGAYFTIQQLLPIINEGGSILLNGSINAHIGMATGSVYSASKAAALSFIRTLSPELLSRKIRINAVSPGPVRTPLHVRLGSLNHIDATESPMIDMVPLGRFGTPEEIARIAVFFASDDSTFVIGGELIADGGMGL